MANRKQATRQRRQRRNRNDRRTSRVSHTIEINSVSGTGAFQLIYFNMLAANLPWLDAVAKSYSRYKYVSANIEFVPHIGTTTQGQISMAFSYDELDNPPTTMSEIARMAGAITRPIYATGRRVVCRANTRRQLPSYRYIPPLEYSALPVASRNEFNPFTLWFGTDTSVNGQIIGTVHVHFDVLLLDPIFSEAHDEAPETATQLLPPPKQSEEQEHAMLHWIFCKKEECRYHSKY